MVTSAWVINHGRALGFDKVGVAPADDLPALARLPDWLELGFAGEMQYMHDAKRRDARALGARPGRAEILSGAPTPVGAESKGAPLEVRSIICCALVYDTNHPRSTETPPDPQRGWVSRYAWGDDYHSVLEEKLEALRDRLAAQAGENFVCKLYVDTGPILERAYAARAGLGWQGKNTCLLDSELGSFFFLGLLVTNLPLEPTAPQADGCGACTLCLDACPTEALVEPYLLDSRRCISYLTIELRGSIPTDLRAPMGRHVFGCDICQDVCPYNRMSLVSDLAAFHPRSLATSPPAPFKSEISSLKSAHSALPSPPSPAAPAAGSTVASPATGHRLALSPAQRDEGPPATAQPPPLKSEISNLKSSQRVPETEPSPDTGHRPPNTLFHPRLDWLASLSESDFKRLFHDSALKRAKHRGLLRNTLVALGNSGNLSFRPLLEHFAASDDALLAEHAQWALNQLR